MHGLFRQRLLLAALGLPALAGAGAAGLASGTGPASALTNCSVSDNAAALDGEEAAFLTLINDYRAQNGVPALTISTNLDRAAAWLAIDMGAQAYFSHTDLLGRSPSTRAMDCGYPAGAGENIAAGTVWDTAQEAFTGWKNSPGHNANMLNSSYRKIGIARAYTGGSPYNWYWVTDFGLVEDGTGGSNPTPTATATPTQTATATPTKTATATPTSTATPSPTAPPETATPPSGKRRSRSTPPASPTSTATATPTTTTTPTPPAGASPASLTNPVPGSTLPGASATFSWSAGTGALEYRFEAGTSPGSDNIVSNSMGLTRSTAVSNLPTTGGAVYVRLWTRLASGWQYRDYTFQAAGSSGGPGSDATPPSRKRRSAPGPGDTVSDPTPPSGRGDLPWQQRGPSRRR